MNREDVPDEDRPVANLCDREKGCEETTVFARDVPCTIEDVKCGSSDRNVSEDMSGQAKRGTVYFMCQVVEYRTR